MRDGVTVSSRSREFHQDGVLGTYLDANNAMGLQNLYSTLP